VIRIDEVRVRTGETVEALEVAPLGVHLSLAGSDLLLVCVHLALERRELLLKPRIVLEDVLLRIWPLRGLLLWRGLLESLLQKV
jgi:hypothetical protein